MKTYLREIEIIGEKVKTILDIFQGDIKKDKAYWKKYHNGKARYFKLEEVKK